MQGAIDAGIFQEKTEYMLVFSVYCPLQANLEVRNRIVGTGVALVRRKLVEKTK